MINNGHISNFFNLERGCRQGDPLSPYLFIIGVELLSLQIKSNPKIKGALVNDTDHLLVNMQMIHSLYLMVVRHHLGRP